MPGARHPNPKSCCWRHHLRPPLASSLHASHPPAPQHDAAGLKAAVRVVGEPRGGLVGRHLSKQGAGGSMVKACLRAATDVAAAALPGHSGHAAAAAAAAAVEHERRPGGHTLSSSSIRKGSRLRRAGVPRVLQMRTPAGQQGQQAAGGEPSKHAAVDECNRAAPASPPPAPSIILEPRTTDLMGRTATAAILPALRPTGAAAAGWSATSAARRALSQAAAGSCRRCTRAAASVGWAGNSLRRRRNGRGCNA